MNTLNIQLKSGIKKTFSLDKVIDSGSQGDILLVRDEFKNRYCAKYYHNASNKQYKIAELLTTINIHPVFTLPAYLSAFKNNKYVELMQYYDVRDYEKIGCYLNNAKDENGKPLFIVNQEHTNYIVKQLLEAFGNIHEKGLVYGDISANNILVNRKNYQIKIIDTANLLPEGYASKYKIYGTGFYRSPETICKKSYVDINSERHSLYVLIFQLLVHCHPLIGKSFYQNVITEEVQIKHLGKNPKFIFDNSNEVLHRQYVKTFTSLDKNIQTFFYQAFSQEALLKYKLRPVEKELLNIL